MITIANDNNFKELIKEDLVLVDFFASWCGPCKMLSPILEEIKDTKIVKVDVDDAPSICKEYAIMSVPTLMIFKNGKMVSKKMGYMPLEMIESWIKEYE